MVIVFPFGGIWTFSIKIDMILAEIKWNLSPLKVFYFLITNIKSKHKLTDLNYNRLSILSRIVLIAISDYGSQIVALIAEGSVILIAI